MLQIAICDDETLLLDEIKEITEGCMRQQQTFSILSTYTNGKDLFYDIQDGKRFDLLLLDIEMPGLSGMELAKRVHELLPDALMIFVTAHYKYAVDAYELLEIQNTDSYIISSQNRLERIPYKEILYIGKDGKNALFHTTASGRQEEIGTDRNRRVRKTLAEVFDELHSEEFYFIERGYIVNLRHVTGISHTDCILTDQTRLPVSQSRLPELKKRLNKYWQDKI